MSPLDVAIVLVFAAWAIGSGFRARREASRGLVDYFLAGRTLRGWQAGMSMAATQFAADTPLLVTGLIATAGIFSLWRLWIYALSFLLLGFVLAAVWHRSGALTDAEDADPADLIDLGAERRAKAERAMDRVRGKFGHEAVVKGLALDEKE